MDNWPQGQKINQQQWEGVFNCSSCLIPWLNPLRFSLNEKTKQLCACRSRLRKLINLSLQRYFKQSSTRLCEECDNDLFLSPTVWSSARHFLQSLYIILYILLVYIKWELDCRLVVCSSPGFHIAVDWQQRTHPVVAEQVNGRIVRYRQMIKSREWKRHEHVVWIERVKIKYYR